jgi:hypothetical protein
MAFPAVFTIQNTAIGMSLPADRLLGWTHPSGPYPFTRHAAATSICECEMDGGTTLQ